MGIPIPVLQWKSQRFDGQVDPEDSHQKKNRRSGDVLLENTYWYLVGNGWEWDDY